MQAFNVIDRSGRTVLGLDRVEPVRQPHAAQTELRVVILIAAFATTAHAASTQYMLRKYIAKNCKTEAQREFNSRCKRDAQFLAELESMKRVLDVMTESAARLCHAHDAAIQRVDGDAFKVAAHYGSIPALPDNERVELRRDTVNGRAILHRCVVHVLATGEGLSLAGLLLSCDFLTR
jgi:hypothetical protein